MRCGFLGVSSILLQWGNFRISEEESIGLPRAEFEMENDFGWKKVGIKSSSFKIPCTKIDASWPLLWNLFYPVLVFPCQGRSMRESQCEEFCKVSALHLNFFPTQILFWGPQAPFWRTQTEIPQRFLSLKLSLSPIAPLTYLPNCNAIIIVLFYLEEALQLCLKVAPSSKTGSGKHLNKWMFTE